MGDEIVLILTTFLIKDLWKAEDELKHLQPPPLDDVSHQLWDRPKPLTNVREDNPLYPISKMPNVFLHVAQKMLESDKKPWTKPWYMKLLLLPLHPDKFDLLPDETELYPRTECFKWTVESFRRVKDVMEPEQGKIFDPERWMDEIKRQVWYLIGGYQSEVKYWELDIQLVHDNNKRLRDREYETQIEKLQAKIREKEKECGNYLRYRSLETWDQFVEVYSRGRKEILAS